MLIGDLGVGELSTGILGVISLVFGGKVMVTKWLGQTRDQKRIEAETDVIALLRTELGRVVEQSTQLAIQVDLLRKLSVEQNISFRTTIDELHSEIKKLREQVSKSEGISGAI